MKLPIGTKVKVTIQEEHESALFKLLNTLEGEIIGHRKKDYMFDFSYQVAFPVEQMDAIQAASKEHFGTKVTVCLPIVNLNRSLGRPKDERYYAMAYESEVTKI